MSKSPTERRPSTPKIGSVQVRLIDYLRDSPRNGGRGINSATRDMTDESWLEMWRRKNGAPIDSKTGEQMEFGKHLAVLTHPISPQKVPRHLRDEDFWSEGGHDDGFNAGVPKNKVNELRSKHGEYEKLPPRAIVFDHYTKNEKEYKRQGYELDIAMPLMLTDRRSYTEQMMHGLGVSPETLYGDGHVARFLGGFAERELMMRSRLSDTWFSIAKDSADTPEEQAELERAIRLHYGKSQMLLNYSHAVSPRARGITGGDNPFERAMANESHWAKIAESFETVLTDFPSVLQFTYDNAGALTFDIAWHLFPGKVGTGLSAAYALMYGAESAGEAASHNMRGLAGFAHARARQIAALRSGQPVEEGDIRQMYMNLDHVSGGDMAKGLTTSIIETVAINKAIQMILGGSPVMAGKIANRIAGTSPSYTRKFIADSAARGYNSLRGAGIGFTQQALSGGVHQAFVRSGVEGQGWNEYFGHIIEGGLMEGLTLLPVGAVGGALNGGGRYKAKSEKELAGLRSQHAVTMGQLGPMGLKFAPIVDADTGDPSTGGMHGIINQSGARAGRLSEQDHDSPHDDENIAEGRRTIARNEATSKVNAKLRDAGLPPVGNRVEINTDEGNQIGEIVDMTEGGVVEIKLQDGRHARVSVEELKGAMVADHGSARQNPDDVVDENLDDQQGAQVNQKYFATQRQFASDPDAMQAYEDAVEQGVEEAAYTRGYKSDPPGDRAIWKMRHWWARKHEGNWNSGEAVGNWAADMGLKNDYKTIKKAWTNWWRSQLMQMRKDIQESGRQPRSRSRRSPNQRRVGAAALAALDRKEAESIINTAQQRAQEIADANKAEQKDAEDKKKENEKNRKEQQKELDSQKKQVQSLGKRLEANRKKLEAAQKKKQREDEKKAKDDAKKAEDERTEQVEKTRFLDDVQSLMLADGTPKGKRAARRIATDELKLLGISTRGTGFDRALEKVGPKERNSFLSRVNKKLNAWYAAQRKLQGEKQKAKAKKAKATTKKPAAKKPAAKKPSTKTAAKKTKPSAKTKTVKKPAAKKPAAKKSSAKTTTVVRPKPSVKKANSITVRKRARALRSEMSKTHEVPELAWFEKLQDLIAQADRLSAYQAQVRQEKTTGWRTLVKEIKGEIATLDSAIQSMNQDMNTWKERDTTTTPLDTSEEQPAKRTARGKKGVKKSGKPAEPSKPKGKTAAGGKGPAPKNAPKKGIDQKPVSKVTTKDFTVVDPTRNHDLQVQGVKLTQTKMRGPQTILKLARKIWSSGTKNFAWSVGSGKQMGDFQISLRLPNLYMLDVGAGDQGIPFSDYIEIVKMGAEYQYWADFETQMFDKHSDKYPKRTQNRVATRMEALARNILDIDRKHKDKAVKQTAPSARGAQRDERAVNTAEKVAVQKHVKPEVKRAQEHHKESQKKVRVDSKGKTINPKRQILGSKVRKFRKGKKFAFDRLRNLFRGRRVQEQTETPERVLERRDTGDVATETEWVAAVRDALVDLRLSIMHGYVSPTLYNRLHRWAHREAQHLWDRQNLQETYASVEGVRDAILGAGERGPKIIEHIIRALGVQGKVAVVMEDNVDSGGKRRVAAYDNGVISIDMLALLGTGRLQDAKYYVTHEVLHFLWEMNPPGFRDQVRNMARVAREMYPELAAKREAEYRAEYEGRDNIEDLIDQQMAADVLLEQTFDLEYTEFMTEDVLSFMEHTVELIKRLMRAIWKALGIQDAKQHRTKMEAMHDAAVTMARIRQGRVGEHVGRHGNAAKEQMRDTLLQTHTDRIERTGDRSFVDRQIDQKLISPPRKRIGDRKQGRIEDRKQRRITHEPQKLLEDRKRLPGKKGARKQRADMEKRIRRGGFRDRMRQRRSGKKFASDRPEWQAPVSVFKDKAPLFASLRQFHPMDRQKFTKEGRRQAIADFYLDVVAKSNDEKSFERAQRYARELDEYFQLSQPLTEQTEQVLNEMYKEGEGIVMRALKTLGGDGSVQLDVTGRGLKGDGYGYYMPWSRKINVDLDHFMYWGAISRGEIETTLTHEFVHHVLDHDMQYVSQNKQWQAARALKSAFPEQVGVIQDKYNRKLSTVDMKDAGADDFAAASEILAFIISTRHIGDLSKVRGMEGRRSARKADALVQQIKDKIVNDLIKERKEYRRRIPAMEKRLRKSGHHVLPETSAMQYSDIVAQIITGQYHNEELQNTPGRSPTTNIRNVKLIKNKPRGDFSFLTPRREREQRARRIAEFTGVQPVVGKAGKAFSSDRYIPDAGRMSHLTMGDAGKRISALKRKVSTPKDDMKTTFLKSLSKEERAEWDSMSESEQNALLKQSNSQFASDRIWTHPIKDLKKQAPLFASLREFSTFNDSHVEKDEWINIISKFYMEHVNRGGSKQKREKRARKYAEQLYEFMEVGGIRHYPFDMTAAKTKLHDFYSDLNIAMKGVALRALGKLNATERVNLQVHDALDEHHSAQYDEMANLIMVDAASLIYHGDPDHVPESVTHELVHHFVELGIITENELIMAFKALRSAFPEQVGELQDNYEFDAHWSGRGDTYELRAAEETVASFISQRHLNKLMQDSDRFRKSSKDFINGIIQDLRKENEQVRKRLDGVFRGDKIKLLPQVEAMVYSMIVANIVSGKYASGIVRNKHAVTEQFHAGVFPIFQTDVDRVLKRENRLGQLQVQDYQKMLKAFASDRTFEYDTKARGSLRNVTKYGGARLTWQNFKTRIGYMARLLRTRYIKRWHAGITLANAIGRDDLGDNLRIINGAQSVAEYAFRYHVPRVMRDEKGRITGHYADKKASRGWVAVQKISRHGHGFMKKAAEFMVLKYGDGRGFSEKRKKELKEFAAKNPDVTEFADGWKRFKTDMLKFYVDLGHITESEAAQIRQSGVPLLRPLKGKGNEIGFQIDEHYVQDPVQALVGSLFIDIRKAMQDSALAELLLEIDAHEEGHYVLQRVDKDNPPPPGKKNNTVSIRHRGTTRRYVIKDRALMEMVQSMRFQEKSFTFDVLLDFKNIISSTATVDPTFMVRNSIRDTLQSAVIGRNWQIPGVSTAKGVADFLAESEVYQDWLLQGGSFGGVTDVQSNPNPARAILSAAAFRNGMSLKDTARMFLAPVDGRRPMKALAIQMRLLWRILSTPSRAVESGTRINQYDRGVRAGDSKRKSIIGARYSSSDFADTGTSRNIVYSMFRVIPFLISSINGMNATYEAAFTKNGQWMGWKEMMKSPQARKVGITMSALTMFSVLVWLWNNEDEERREQYEALNPYEKATHLHMMGIPDPFRPDHHMKFPIPFQIGQMSMVIPQMVLDSMAGLDTAKARDTAVEIISGALFLNVMPGALQAGYNIMTNTNFFGSEIIPPHMFHFPKHLQSHEHTPEMYKWAARALKKNLGYSYSPLHIQQIFGTFMTNIWRTTEALVVDGDWDQEKYGQNPYPKGVRFATGGAAISAPNIPGYGKDHQRFWRMQKRARGVVDAVERVRKYDKRGDEYQNVRKQVRENRRAYRAAQQVQELWRKIRPFRLKVDRIRRDPKLSAQEKRRRIESINRRLNKRYAGYLTRYEDLVQQAHDNITG